MFSHNKIYVVYGEVYGWGMSVSQRQRRERGRAEALHNRVRLWRQIMCCTWGKVCYPWLCCCCC